jgi:hypothetical protein
LLEGEELVFTERAPPATPLPDAEINEKYVRGEIRIVTEQARYPLNTIKNSDGESSIHTNFHRNISTGTGGRIYKSLV